MPRIPVMTLRRFAAVVIAALLAAAGLATAPASANGNCVTYWQAGGGWSGAPAAGGTGTAADPYQVGSESDLNEVRFCVGAHFRQIADITMATPWTMITDDFTGGYDGGGHSISNLTIANPGSETAMFTRIKGGSFSNLNIAGDVTNGASKTAMLAAFVEGGSVLTSVSGRGAVSGASIVGGLVGSVTGSTLTNVAFDGTVTGTSYTVGGLAGEVYDSVISSVFTAGSVTGANDTGGVSGYNCGVTMSEAASEADVTGGQYVGGIVGELDSCYGEITNAYYSGDVSGSSSVGGIGGQIQSATLSALYSEGTVTATGQNAGGLVGVIYGTGVSNSHSSSTVAVPTNAGGAIGSTNTSLDRVSASGDVSGTDYVAGLVGDASSNSITDSWASGSVTSNGGSYVGGLVGNANTTILRRTYAEGDVTSSGSGSEVGGLAGGLVNRSVVNSYATGNVTAPGSSRVGGLAGSVTVNAASAAFVRSYATGSVSGNDLVGGLAGVVQRTPGGGRDFSIVDSYSQGSVTAATATAGGLVGRSSLTDHSLTVASSYATGAVTAPSAAGGLVGTIGGGTVSEPVQSFWNETANPSLPDGTGTKKTEAQLQDIATFQDAGWDIQAGGDYKGVIWGICVPAEPGVNGGFPFLMWPTETNPCAHATVPDAPVLNTLTPADGALKVVATPGPDGGSPVTSVEYSLDGGDWVASGGTSGTFTISGLTNGTTYRVAVRAVNAVGPSDASNEVSAVPGATPSPGPAVKDPTKPKHLKAKAARKAVRVTWDVPSKDGGSPIAGYKVWLSKRNKREFSNYRTTTRTRMRFAKLRPGSKYWVKVKAVNSQTNGCASVVKFRTAG